MGPRELAAWRALTAATDAYHAAPSPELLEALGDAHEAYHRANDLPDLSDPSVPLTRKLVPNDTDTREISSHSSDFDTEHLSDNLA